MIKYKWIEFDTVLAIHDFQIQEHSGAGGIRDIGLIESAINRPRNLLLYESPSVVELAASYAFGLTKKHGFIDGNKRTAYVVTRLFLKLHGWDLTATAEERVLIFERLGKGLYTAKEFSLWMHNSCRKIT